MSKNIKISVITINYNNLLGLRNTFKSVFDQTFKNFEYIVIDGNSSDGSKEFIQENSSKFSYFVSEPDSGIYNAINKGLQRAVGDYVLILNSGDSFFDDSTLEKASRELESGEDIIYGKTLFVNWSQNNFFVAPPAKLSFNFFCNGGLIHQSVFIKRALHEKAGMYDEKLKIVSDWKFFLEVFAFWKATYKPIELIISKYDKTGISSIYGELLFKEKQLVLNQGFLFFQEGSLDKNPYRADIGPLTLRKIFKYCLPYGLIRIIQSYRGNRTK